ncbi:hypothetical protein PSI9734_00611 [Pseudidiomarina piscicola]|uniref:DUF2937 domain-containing protein n=1 Tax=Pseudidiomarina piscicola TaxID=2614830 RepID=A0A6S6WM89_9GAMM|nr:DUF2937 family protein [Pseudidiomarina piscicola]CAB0150040.1 hypothetical protein PSI9734_00611 [Pseudidiomarina piscicola]VZT39484.1 hypothetical protein PSI9734_00611 [Pseudomonas aeruginosa]
MIYRYFILCLAAAALLLGIQAPNLLAQYQQRLAAQYAEAMVYYRQYQDIAETHYDGSIEALITAHQQSDQPAFREEADIIRNLQVRVKSFEQQQKLLQQPYPAQLWSLTLYHEPELMNGTLEHYSFNVPLNQKAIATGALIALVLVVLFDLLGALMKMAVKGLWRRRRQRSLNRHP